MLPDPSAPERTAERRAALVGLLGERHGGAPLVVSDVVNIRYLTGFDGSNGALLVRDGAATLFTDSRYVHQAQQQAAGVAVQLARDVAGAAVAAAGGGALLEGHQVSASAFRRIRADADPTADLADDLVGELRAVKDPAEAVVLQRACEVSEDALRQVLADGVLGRSERDLARRLEWLLGDGDGEGPGFDSIVAAGPNSAVPHHRPTGRTIERGDLLKIDFGARVRGYHADITRTFVVAADPAPWQRRLHGLVSEAQRVGREAVAGGRAVAEVDAAARGVIAGSEHADRFGHGLGHGVGLAIHERPLIAAGIAGTLEPGMVITIEPGVYLPGSGGVRIEDTVLVEARGCRSLVTLERGLATVA